MEPSRTYPSTLDVEREVQSYFLNSSFFIHTNTCALVQNITRVSSCGSSTEVQKLWWSRSHFSRVRLERRNLTTCCYARIIPSACIKNHSFVGLICLCLSKTVSSVPPLSLFLRCSADSKLTSDFSKKQTNHTHTHETKQKNPLISDGTFKGKFIDGLFTKWKYAKCLIHIYASIAFIEERHNVVQKPRRHCLGETVCPVSRKSRDSACSWNQMGWKCRGTQVPSTMNNLVKNHLTSSSCYR